MEKIELIYEGVDGLHYGTYYKNNESIDVQCNNKKWYDMQGNYIRDWNDEDDKEALSNMPW